MATEWWTVFNNDVRGGDDEAFEIDDFFNRDGRALYIHFAQNTGAPSADSSDASIDFSLGGQNTLAVVERCVGGWQGEDDDEAFEMDIPGDVCLVRLRNCTDVAPARRVLVRTYFVECPGDCGAGTVPRLTRAELTPAGTIALTPLVDGIENLQLEFGFDTDNDSLPDVYRVALSGVADAADNDWSNVVAVRLYLIARSQNPAVGHVDTMTFDLGLNGTLDAAGDGFKRHVHTTLVRVMNVAGWREIP